LEAAEKVASNLESEVTTTLWRRQRRVGRRRLRAAEGDPRDATETPTDTQPEDAGAGGNADAQRKPPAADGPRETGLEDSGEGLLILLNDENDVDEDSDKGSPLSAVNHVKRLREMANLLNKVADALTIEDPAAD
jgi:hypothetical protein